MPTPLTEREKHLCELLIQAKTNREIAVELEIGTTTVDTHLQNIYAKLGARIKSGCRAEVHEFGRVMSMPVAKTS